MSKPQPKWRDRQKNWVVWHTAPDGTQPIRLTLEIIHELMPDFKACECHTAVVGANAYAFVYGKKRQYRSHVAKFAHKASEKYLHAESIHVEACRVDTRGQVITAGSLPMRKLLDQYDEMQRGKNHTFLPCTNGEQIIRRNSGFMQAKATNHDTFDKPKPPKPVAPSINLTKKQLWTCVLELQAKVADLEKKIAELSPAIDKPSAESEAT
jgi:hypothetical protein